MGFFGSSCSAAITKNFGALTMSITSTARKAATLFLSFALFDNECTFEHVSGMIVFISALTAKSVRRTNKRRKSDVGNTQLSSFRRRSSDVEIGSAVPSRMSSFDSADNTAASSHGSVTSEVLMTTNRRRMGNHRSASPSLRAPHLQSAGHYVV
jgi:UAA transporter family